MENYATEGMSSTQSIEYAPHTIEKLTCKTIYNTLLSYQHFPPPTAEKRLFERGSNFQERQKSIHFLVVSQTR